MPGIAGIVARARPAQECEGMLARMVEAMRHETFYESGRFSVPEIGVYVGWTAHPSSFAARQARAFHDRGLVGVFAGECFGVEVESELARAYDERGVDVIRNLNGVFSGLVVDRKRRSAQLFNDRYGLERVYFHHTNEALYFASEAKALLAILPELRSLNERGLAELMAFGCTRDDQTLFQGVELLAAGSIWAISPGGTDKARYFTPSQWESVPELTPEAFDEEFVATFARVLPRYVENGTGLGVSLTAGLDTRMIVASLRGLADKPVAYTFSGRTERTLDERIAAAVAGTLGMEHQVLRIGSDFISDYGQQVDRTVYVTDGCFGATGAHEIYLNAKARVLAPIRLTGNYGSEVLRGMSTLKPLGLSPDLFDRDFASLVSAAQQTQMLPSHPVTFAAFHEVPSGLFGSFSAGRSQLTLRTPYLDNDLVALAYRASASSRQSRASVFKVIESGDPRLATIATDRGVTNRRRSLAYAVRRAWAEATFKLDCMYVDGPPKRLAAFDPIVRAVSKIGARGLHKYLPYRHWFSNELRPYVTRVLTDPGTLRLPYWNIERVGAMVDAHASGRYNYVREINAVLTIESLHRQFIGSAWSARHSAIA